MVGIRRRASRVLVVTAGLLVLLACSEPTRYRVLSFFFDGVPVPGEASKEKPPVRGPTASPEEGGPARASRPRRTMVRHAPYRDGRCRDCHNPDDGVLYRSVTEGLCQTCHEQFPGDQAYLHGPVAVNACLFCHNPHESEHPHLLRTPVEQVCERCHMPDRLTSRPEHEPGEQPRACTECHDPHGGDNPFFLRRRAP